MDVDGCVYMFRVRLLFYFVERGTEMKNTKPVMCAREVNHANFHLLYASREHFRHRHKHIAQQ